MKIENHFERYFTFNVPTSYNHNPTIHIEIQHFRAFLFGRNLVLVLGLVLYKRRTLVEITILNVYLVFLN